MEEESVASPEREEGEATVDANANADGDGGYWCYMCNIEVAVSLAEDTMEMICSECGDGFIEALITAESTTNEHNQGHGGGGEEDEDDVDHVYAHLLRQLMGQSTGNENNDQRDGQNSSGAIGHDIGENHMSQEVEQTLRDDLGHGQVEVEDSESGSIIIGVGPDEWDSSDENENEEEDWEEPDEEEEDRNESTDHTSETADADEEVQSQTRRTRWGSRWRSRDVSRLNRRMMNAEHDLHHYLQEIFENLAGNNIEVRVELPEGPMYVGNPGDYLDARGFEQLLQHLAENDNSRRGAPPAAKSVVQNLPSVLSDGSYVCPVCKDVMTGGEVAKQLPCLHLYHPDCILPWLSTRNSCPICRYELPTDDADYEEQKGNTNGRVHATDNLNSSMQSRNQDASSNFTMQSSSQESSLELPTDLTYDSQNRSDDYSSGQFSNTEVENDFMNGNLDIDSVLEGSQVLGNQIAAESELEINREVPEKEQEIELLAHEENANDHNNDSRDSEEESIRATLSQNLGRGWFLMAAGPVLSVVGLVLVLCFGNHSIGGRIQHHIRSWGGQRHDFPREPLQESNLLNDNRDRRRWWMPFQR